MTKTAYNSTSGFLFPDNRWTVGRIPRREKVDKAAYVICILLRVQCDQTLSMNTLLTTHKMVYEACANMFPISYQPGKAVDNRGYLIKAPLAVNLWRLIGCYNFTE